MPSLGPLAALGAAAGLLCLARSRRAARRVVVITGGCGNLGTKLARHLLAAGWRVVLLEKAEFFRAEVVPDGAEVVLGDAADGAGGWAECLAGADAVVHFSAVNPYPNADWADSAGSMLHTFNVFLAASARGVRRVVFASSNHVMGGYKERPELGAVRPTSAPMVGTSLRDPEATAKSGDAVAYGAAKLAGEQLAKSLAAAGARTTFALLRIGWCQPGANEPSTISAAGCPEEFQTGGKGGGKGAPPPPADVDEAWFKGMWLSNGDFLRYFEAALDAPCAAGGTIHVNAMSANAGMRWSLDETVAALGVRARDDVRAARK